ncbi:MULTISPECIES: 1,3-beta-galactosyl-N-acetylhexosamine phosphorylase [unclassified Clostridium]|jgi:1,3-beta-galactosyl-N-acetylhexosamine phosphorylase|uniref:1,3-beta-galactosyl-N-acetylhexosamine phosphorylase n=1 Tax=unclassified Clostridium TaxID=2614128 RepID=UPI0025C607C4|nr:1,3-beta-galactosyl-N-acetylhexosamine phosphorylase [Clostridium sp.]MCI6692349.1 1,3-beta-galactosyl-N-acetylhexosamine phosphorylase [Clostridium sp.]MDY2630972.1 1,3-beta-galactosyl-N-acetylhexosamine phosphorylase [Clostridium sp.]MDY4254009.1 1,3-beta-galactosyl-N-acetylhexosamine phosphorylase [Clostridium sp.]MDY6226947.1 1,3-beta-galactosyl-N-acetylhexosamine phosphorylase [Clostridium sp.]
MAKTRGRVTLPSESNFLKETKELLARWGADAIRDSDGTKLSDDIKKLDAKIYTTYFVSRGHNDFAEKHMDECQQIYLMSNYKLATSNTLEISFLESYYDQQIKADYNHDPKIWWEVIDRTTNKVITSENWEYDKNNNVVKIYNCEKFHEYTVSFLAYILWDPTQMYNHITNNWGDVPHDIPFDVRKPNSNKYIFEYLKQWLKDNPDTDVVRFTTFFYHFTLIFNNLAKEKFVDWCGYGASVSTEAILAFEEEYKYRLRPEVFVQNGYYNSTFCVPTKEYLDYIDFQQRFVYKTAKDLVELTHEAGKEAMMFLGDNWIGTEPYGKYFSKIGLDAVVGSVGGGATLRLIGDIPGVKYHEGRFLPYFFPDTFYEGNDPTIEAIDNWLSARRAIMRKPIDRIGYGGYPSLAYKFPKFVDYIEKTCDEFREIYENIHDVAPYCGLKVAILNSWGKLRSWHTYMVAHALWCKQIYSYNGMLESLSGASVDVTFISFDEIKEKGVPEDIDVIINAGDAHTAFSGGDVWKDSEFISIIREWIYNGGGFVGIGEPTAVENGGHFFQLADAFGVDKELGFTLHTDKYFHNEVEKHFIKEDKVEEFDFGEGMKNIYATKASTKIIAYNNGEVNIASNEYGRGRCVYIAGLPYSEQNTRLLMRSLYYSAHKEEEFKKWYADNLYCEVHAYPSINKYAILNNTNKEQDTNVYDGNGNMVNITLKPGEIKWMVM